MQDIQQLLAKSLNEIKRLKAANHALEQARREPIAIVGAACRYPGGIGSLDQLWTALEAGRDGIGTMRTERWPMQRFLSDDPHRPGGIYSDAMGLLDAIDRFDPAHFGLKRDEAIHIDPQHRLLMEVAWEAFEDAGYAVEAFSGSRTGVYVGIMNDDYGQLQGPLEAASLYIGSGIAKSCAAGRLAYTFGLEGPTLALDTACSSSLVGVHLAVQALRRGECDAALAGGVNLILSPQGTVVACRSQMLSPSGRCRTFDASADGYVRSEGCGLVLLKRLADAERDGDRILALIRGSAVNHDGRTQGLTAPSGQAQRRVIAAALADAGVAAAEVGFVECHGTGTSLGDPIELRALEASYVHEAAERAPLVVGALKSNLGHMESAAGIGGLHKAIQVVRHRMVPKNLHFETINPQIRVDFERLRIAAEAVAMPADGRALAGVSSFGFSGTNAHLIVEAYAPATDANASAGGPAGASDSAPLQLFRLAAQSGAALVDYAGRYLGWLDDALARHVAPDPAALCYTAAVGRGDGACRIALTFETPDDLRACLHEYLDVAGGDPSAPVPKSCAAEWVIGGAADVDWGVARALHARRGFYRERVEHAWASLGVFFPDGPAVFRRLCDGVADSKDGGPDGGTAANATLPHTVHRWALAQLLIHLGLQPARVRGYGAGEYLAAAVAGLVDWDAALLLAAGGAVPAGLKAGRVRCAFASTFGDGEAPALWQRDGGPAAASVPPLADDAWPDDADGIVVELGAGLALRLGDAADTRLFRWTHGRTNRDAARPLESFLAQAYMAGLPVRWARVFDEQPPRRQSQPGYPFQRERVWTDWGYSFDASLPSTVGRAAGAAAVRMPALATGLAAEPVAHPVLRSMFACPSGARNFSGEVSLAALPYLAAHRILGEIVLPASAQLDLIATAGRACWPGRPLLIDELQLPNRCVLGDEPLDLYCHLRPAEGRVELHGRTRGAPGWTLYARARIGPDEAAAPPAADPAAWRAACAETVPVRRHYHEIAQVGLEYEADFQGIFELSRGAGGALAKIALPPGVDQSLDGYSAHPILLDACLQAISAAAPPDADGELLIPAAMRGIHLYRPLPELIWCRVDVHSDGAGRSTRHATLTIADMQGEPVMRIDRFETTRYTGAVARPAETWADWLYAKHWVPAVAVASVTPATPAAHVARHWLLLADGGAACAALATMLAARGHRVSVLGREAAPADADGFGALLDRVAADGGLDGVIYGWSLDGFDPEAAGEGLDASLGDCARLPLWLCQAALAPGRRELALHFVTRGSQPAGETRVSAPLAALVWGLVGSFVNEQRSPARLVDLDPDCRDGRADAALLVQAIHADGDEAQYAIRDGRLLVARLRRATLPASPAPVIDPEASYLITGGFGQLGVETATALARQGARHLVLVGRDPARGDADPALAALREMGVQLHPLAADVGDRAAFAPRLAECLRELPPLKGVVHSAGGLADGVLSEQSWERYLAVLGAKVHGTLNLHYALHGRALDFFVLYSSAAALLGNPGQTNYAAANAFLDSFAAYRRGLGQAGLAIGWAGWAGGGMAAGRADARADAAIGLIPQEQGAEVIARQFAHRDGDVALIPMRIAALAGQDRMPLLRPLLAELVDADARDMAVARAERAERRPGSAGGTALLAGFAALDAAARVARLKRYLDDAVRKLLNHPDALDDRASLFDLGLDSLLSIDLRMQLEKDLACSLSTTVLHDYPTIDALAGFLAERVGALPAGAAAPRAASVPAAAAATSAAATTATTAASPAAHAAPPAEPHRAASPALPAGAGPDDIAIIGVAGRYPGAADLRAFWDNLRDGHDAITAIPPDRWNHDACFDGRRNVPGKSYSAWGGFIDGVDAFDPAFFSISPRMAAYLDPKERLFLETVWNLLEEAGETRERMQQAYGAQVGVFVGAMYQLYGACAADEGERTATALSSYNAIAHRTSYFFNLRGPSVALDTMCSSSLTAVHYACRSLLDGDCALAIAGGVNLSLHPRKYVGLSQAQIVGSHADSRSFSDGDGYLPAEGVGAVLLKPLARALADDDRILAVIKASSVNHGGRSSGYYAPNANAQVELMEASFRKAGISPDSIGYVEAAANGTSLGDAVELKALARVFDGAARDGRTLPIGTVKSNIGHPEAASGIAQLTKVILQMQHETLVPSIKTEPLNPNVDLSRTPFRLLARQAAWPSDPARPRRATVSSFGASGANAHLIVEAFEPVAAEPAPAAGATAPQAEIVVLSARTPAQLAEVARRLLAWLATRDDAKDGAGDPAAPLADRGRAPSLANLAHTLQTGREAMDCRLALLVDGLDALRDGLQRFLGMPAGAADLAMYHGNVQDQLEMRNLLSGAAGDAMAQALAAERNLEGLMLHWVQGGNVPWRALREGRPARRIVLPTYPFERARYWLSGSAGEAPGEADAAREPDVVDGRA